MTDSLLDRWYGFIAVIMLITLAVFAAVGIPIWVGSYYVDRSHCHAFSAQTNRQTKFEVLVKGAGLPLQWDCFTPTAEGKWVPTSALREFGSTP